MSMLGWASGFEEYKWIAVGAVVLGLGGYAGYLKIENADLEASFAKEKTAREKEKSDAEHLARIESENYRLREQSWAKSHEKVVNNAIQKTEAALAHVVAADASSERLRQRIAAITATLRGTSRYPATGGTGTATGDTIGVLADVLGRSDAVAGVMASTADKARIAGIACEQSYDAIAAAPVPVPVISPSPSRGWFGWLSH